MRIDIITIFPEFYPNLLDHSIIKAALIKKALDVNVINLRDFSHNKHKKVDDTIYGGGAGMLIQFPPLYDAINALRSNNTTIVYLSPQGHVYNQETAIKLAKLEHLVLICGHYEGVDARILDFVDLEISIGDYILTGGEIASMVIIDSISRLLPGVIDNESVLTDSLSDGLLKYPQFTKPAEYKGYKVPDILLSGDHEKIRKYRLEQKLKNTITKRPDLIKNKQ